MAEPEVADCTWLEPGGTEAATVIVAFLQGIGVPVAVEPVVEGSRLPGLAVSRGAVRIDPAIPGYPGDLLHEAGHLAVTPPEARAGLAAVGDDPGEEMAAIAWSVAAAKACGVPLEVLFHPAGYKGGAESLIENFAAGRTFGVPLLAWYGLTSEAQFPAMARWLR